MFHSLLSISISIYTDYIYIYTYIYIYIAVIFRPSIHLPITSPISPHDSKALLPTPWQLPGEFSHGDFMSKNGHYNEDIVANIMVKICENYHFQRKPFLGASQYANHGEHSAVSDTFWYNIIWPINTLIRGTTCKLECLVIIYKHVYDRMVFVLFMCVYIYIDR